MDEYQKQLFEEEREQSRAQDKGILTVSGAVCTLSVAVWKGTPGGIAPGSAWLLWACWALMGVAVVLLLVSHGASRWAIAQALEDDATGLGGALGVGIPANLVRHINHGAVSSVALGTGAFLWFALENLDRLASL